MITYIKFYINQQQMELCQCHVMNFSWNHLLHINIFQWHENIAKIFHSAFDGLLKGHQSVAKLTLFGTGFKQRIPSIAPSMGNFYKPQNNPIFTIFTTAMIDKLKCFSTRFSWTKIQSQKQGDKSIPLPSVNRAKQLFIVQS